MTERRFAGFSPLGSKCCKGLCDRLTSPRPHKAYSTHYYCTRCDYWGNKELLTEKNRCACCNFRPRMKTWHNKRGGGHE